MEVRESPSSQAQVGPVFHEFSVEFRGKSRGKVSPPGFHHFSTDSWTGNIIANMPGQILFPRYRERGKWKMENLLLHLPVRPDLLSSVWTPRSGLVNRAEAIERSADHQNLVRALEELAPLATLLPWLRGSALCSSHRTLGSCAP